MPGNGYNGDSECLFVVFSATRRIDGTLADVIHAIYATSIEPTHITPFRVKHYFLALL